MNLVAGYANCRIDSRSRAAHCNGLLASSGCSNRALNRGDLQKQYSRIDEAIPLNLILVGTRLSDHVWKLMDKGSPFTITWQILSRASSFNPSSGLCRLCLKEKFFIMFKPATATLNKRNEIYASCRHRTSKLLAKSKS